MPIVSGGAGGEPFNGGTITARLFVNDNANEIPLEVHNANGVAPLLDVYNDDGAELRFDGTGLLNLVSQSADALAVSDAGGGIFTPGATLGLHCTGYNAAPADNTLVAGAFTLWFDQTNGAPKLMVKAKQADGTVKTAAIALA